MKLKGILTMSEGTWSDVYYAVEELRKAFKKTNFENLPIFLDFDENLRSLVGKVESAKMNAQKDKVFLDVDLFDNTIVPEIYKKKVPFAIAPKVNGDFITKGKSKKKGRMKKFEFISFGLVLNPSNRNTLIKR